MVSREVDPPETMPVTMACVEIPTGPPAPAALPVADVPERDPVPVPVVEVTVIVPVGEVTVVKVVLAEAALEPPAAAAADAQYAVPYETTAAS